MMHSLRWQSPLFWYNHKDSAEDTYYNAAIVGGYVNYRSMFPTQ